MNIFNNAIKNSTASDDLDTRIENLNDFFTVRMWAMRKVCPWFANVVRVALSALWSLSPFAIVVIVAIVFFSGSFAFLNRNDAQFF